MKKQIIYTLIFSLVIFYINNLWGNYFQGDQNLNITSEVNDDIYLAGENILIDATVHGDLVAAGGDITIQDTITEDVLMVGGNLNVMGYIGDDLRIGGGTVFIYSTIEGDLLIASGKVTVGKNAVINGDIHLAGGKLIMNGTVRGKAKIRGGEVFWNGVAEDQLSIKAGSLVMNGTILGKSELAAQKIDIGPEARIFGDVEYWNSKGSLDFKNALQIGAVSSYNTGLEVYDSDFNWRHLGFGLILFMIYRFLAAAFIIALLIWMFHRFFSRNGAETNRNYINHLGLGVLYVIGLPLVIILAFVTVIGIPIGFFLMMFYSTTIVLGHILAAILIAYGLNNFYEKNWTKRYLFLIAITSYLSLKLLAAIPLLGFLFSLAIVMITFGTILKAWWRERRMVNSTIVD